MKKELYVLIVLGIIIVVLLGFLFWPANKINAPQKNPTQTQQTIEGIQVISPKPNSIVSSPIKIIGVVNNGGWNGFEGQVGIVELFNGEGTVIMTAILKAKSEWTKPPVNFEADLNFSGYTGDAVLNFKNENPSGDPARDKTFTLPIKIK